MTMQPESIPAGMGQCEVTGQIVPEDDLVTLHGQRVCAEGKAILLERLRSGEAMPGETMKPTVLRRFSCIFVDGLIIGVPTAIATALVSQQRTQGQQQAFFMIGVVTILSTAVAVLYFGAMHASRGQTLGKMAGKLKVVNDADNSPISPSTAYTRALLYSGPSFVTGAAYFTATPVFMSIASLVVGVYGITNVVLALVDRDRQRALHDRVCGTRVIDLT